MVGTFRIRVTLIGDFINTISGVSTDLETQTFTLTPRKRTYTTTIRGTINDSNSIEIGTSGQVPTSTCNFFFGISYETSLFTSRKPEIIRQSLNCEGYRLRQITIIQRIA